jgi:hypothetical protein
MLGSVAAGAEHLAVEQRAIGPTPTVMELEAAIAIPAALAPLRCPPQCGFPHGSPSYRMLADEIRRAA